MPAIASPRIQAGSESDHLQKLERFATIGRLSASLLHEINNPLSAALLWLEQHDDRQAPHIRQAWDSMQLMRRYIEAARQQICQESRFCVFSVRPELEQVKRILIPLARRQNVHLRFNLDEDRQLQGDPVKFQQIIANLVTNAIDAYATTPEATKDKRVIVRISGIRDDVSITVTDYGCGIPAGQLERIFEPFYSTKCAAGRGLGIGLSDVKRYVEIGFRGSIRVASTRQQGTRFTIKLPSAPSL